METNDKIAKRVLKTVCDYFEQPIEGVTSASRKQHFVVPRKISMKLIRENTTLSLECVGTYFKGEGRPHKDHATVLHACRSLNQLKDWKYGPRTIEEHIQVLRHKLQSETAKQWPIQVRRYKYEYK